MENLSAIQYENCKSSCIVCVCLHTQWMWILAFDMLIYKWRLYIRTYACLKWNTRTYKRSNKNNRNGWFRWTFESLTNNTEMSWTIEIDLIQQHPIAMALVSLRICWQIQTESYKNKLFYLCIVSNMFLLNAR